MKREDIKKIFPDATEEQLKGLLDINTADIGKAKGELEAVKADLEKANGTLKEYETTIADMKKSAEGNEDFKKKFEELEQRIADDFSQTGGDNYKKRKKPNIPTALRRWSGSRNGETR